MVKGLKNFTEADVENPDFNCKEGDSFMVDCNFCNCLEPGKPIFCSMMICQDD